MMEFGILAFGIGPGQMILLAVVGVLLFGKRLPKIGGDLAKGIVEFKKGLAGVEANLDEPAHPASPFAQGQAAPPAQPGQPQSGPVDRPRPEAPKFELPSDTRRV